MSPYKKSIFVATVAVMVWLLVECVALVAISVSDRALFIPSRMGDRLKAIAPNESEQAALATRGELKWNDYVEVLHPYFGYVADPQGNQPFWQVSDTGFIFSRGRETVTKRSAGGLVVAVFGGSFANGEYTRLKAALEARAVKSNRRVDVVNFSLAGFKQPQQLMVLNYMMAMGAQFDVVVNIDGFNDVTLPVIENLPNQVNPFFPRAWNRRTAGSISQADLKKIGHIEFIKQKRADWSHGFLTTHLFWSPTLSLIWKWRDSSMNREIYMLQKLLLIAPGAGNSYTMTGPKYTYKDDHQLYVDLATFWANSSAQMDAVCKANGARYLHFLQPNQYVPDSKPMADDERRIALTKGHPYERAVVLGYPALRLAGEKLGPIGVKFFDLTDIFDHVRESVYVDDCCHLNERGYDIVAERIVAEIVAGDK